MRAAGRAVALLLAFALLIPACSAEGSQDEGSGPGGQAGSAGPGAGAPTLNALAGCGGTASGSAGDEFLTPSDSSVLQDELSKIAISTITVGIDDCSIALDPPPEEPELVHLVVQEASSTEWSGSTCRENARPATAGAYRRTEPGWSWWERCATKPEAGAFWPSGSSTGAWSCRFWNRRPAKSARYLCPRFEGRG